MSKHINVNPDHYKVAGRERQGDAVIQNLQRQQFAQQQAQTERWQAKHSGPPWEATAAAASEAEGRRPKAEGGRAKAAGRGPKAEARRQAEREPRGQKTQRTLKGPKARRLKESKGAKAQRPKGQKPPSRRLAKKRTVRRRSGATGMTLKRTGEKQRRTRRSAPRQKRRR